MEFNTWLAFLAATALISITPGAGAVNTMSTAIKFGFVKTLPSIMGLQVGLIIYLLIVAAGLGAILAASEQLFNVIKWFGVGYLVYLGIMKWKESELSKGSCRNQSKRKSFASAVVVNLTNPKAIVFLAAFLPQFVQPDLPLWPQYLIMGVTMIVIDILVMLGYSSLALRITPALSRHEKLQSRVFGSMFIACGGLLAASQK
ncbi:homoserine/homoserine lactone efflux protein [Endozoicomonas sp. OPT23]|uniref:homoserine/homoserine lactone efflux protein n=1 Tax=Endozoicomonas sp. OPT23 TaxID=2072845 RepID=UPI00129A89B9|nr:homoserine/homoserine lactone efflux protein [Endozoicomonas sp. OPT23]MRI33231.1 homoserine/homoserine lactone efflux protein [Endozoicomonas sp. OPT23]